MSRSAPAQRHPTPGPGTFAARVALALIVLPALCYAALLAATAVNVPYLDDYDTILRFLLETREADSSALDLLLAQHVEHRLVLLRVIALGMLEITGQIDFIAMAWIGYLGLCLLVVGLFLAFLPGAALKTKLILFSPVSLLLFQPQFWDAFFWATSSLSNLWVLPLALAALLTLARDGAWAVSGAALLAAIASITQGNGLLVLPSGLLLLGLQARGRAALCWTGLSCLLGLLYASDFRAVDGAPGLFESLKQTPVLIHYALNFLGSAAGFAHPLASGLLGALLLASGAALFFAGFPRQNPVLYSLLFLLVASAALNALGRGYISGAEYPLAAVRYRFYSSAVLAVSYLCWAEWIGLRTGELAAAGATHGRRFLAASLTLALAFSALSYGRYAPKALEVSNQLRLGLQHFRTRGRGLRHPDVRHAGGILERAVAEGLYSPPLIPSDAQLR